jgi:plasmid stabilization system protein ParE
MNESQGFALHPLAPQDITDIWEFIGEHKLLAARRVREDILEAIRELVLFPIKASNGLTSPPAPRLRPDRLELSQPSSFLLRHCGDRKADG